MERGGKKRRRRRGEKAEAEEGGGGGGRGRGDCLPVAAERRAKAEAGPEDPTAPARPPAPGSSLAAAAARRLPHSSSSPAHPTSRSLPPLRFAPGPARPGRGPPRCRPPWQRRPARGKSSPGISCGLAWFRLLPPRLRRLPAPQPHSGPPCLSCDRTDTAGGLEWNKLKAL